MGYSALLESVVGACLTLDLNKRPDILDLLQLIAPVMAREIDRLLVDTTRCTEELEAERRLKRMHQTEAAQHKQTIHSLVLSNRGRGGSGVTADAWCRWYAFFNSTQAYVRGGCLVRGHSAFYSHCMISL